MPHTSVRYGITRLRPDQAGTADPLRPRREHCTIENHVHRHHEGLLREDAFPVHRGAGPAVLAAVRVAALNL